MRTLLPSVLLRLLDEQIDPSSVSEANHPLSRLRERSTRGARRVREGTPSTETTLTRAEDGVASPASGRGNDSLRSSLTGFFSSNPRGTETSVPVRSLDGQSDPSPVSEANHPLSRLRERSTREARRVREGTPSTETTLTRAEDGVASPASGRGNDSLRSSLTGFFSSNPRGTETSVPVRSLDGQSDPSPVSEANHPLSRLRERSTREARRVREGTPSTETTLTRAEDGVASPASGRGNDSLRSSLTGFFSSNPRGTETSVPVRSLDGQTDPSPVSEANHPLSRLRERSTREARRVREGTPSTETTLTRAEDGVASPASGRGNDS